MTEIKPKSPFDLEALAKKSEGEVKSELNAVFGADAGTNAQGEKSKREMYEDAVNSGMKNII